MHTPEPPDVPDWTEEQANDDLMEDDALQHAQRVAEDNEPTFAEEDI